MKNKEIALVNLFNRTSSLMRIGFQISNYGKLDQLLETIIYRVENNYKTPDFFVLNNTEIDSSEFDEFNKKLKQLNLNIPTIILDHFPSPQKMKVYQSMGSGDYLDSNVSDEAILRQLRRIETSIKLNTDSKKKKPFKYLAKRMFDISVTSILLMCLSPLFLIVMIAIRLESKGPVFYWQKRVGSGYRIFNFYKFRSMRVDADKMIENMTQGNHYAVKENNVEPLSLENTEALLIGDDGFIAESTFLNKLSNDQEQSFKKFENDPRITKVGHWIRKTSIDELPQLINVLIGDMSLVGNRPLPLYEAETLTSDEWSERFLAPAGITGLWQVTERGKKATSPDSRKKLDNEYARKHNLLMDIKILAKTPLAAIQQENV